VLYTSLVQAQTINYTAEKNGIKVTGVPNPNTFTDAKIALKTPTPSIPTDTGKMTFSFDVSNYTLGAKTPDADQVNCAYSAKGQHIHFILDNAPYQASYSPDITTRLKAGHHVLMAFLSRSYHESIKASTAFLVKEFDTGKKEVDTYNEKKPHLYYSRPKGDYIGNREIKKVLLDFYLVNCTLSDKGYRVRATINGNVFILPLWEPYFIEGLPLGESKVKLELIDKKDKLVLSPFNSTERTIKLIKEPDPQ
jgi:hypothetical protein